MREGKLPNLSKLVAVGSYKRLRTTFPSLSPVAWSTLRQESIRQNTIYSTSSIATSSLTCRSSPRRVWAHHLAS